MYYDYREAVGQDVKDYILDNFSEEQIEALRTDDGELISNLYDEMWVCDHVTGCPSGSYTFNTWKAEENLAHNWELAREAIEEFGFSKIMSAEELDVTIRCYLLSQIDVTMVCQEIMEEKCESVINDFVTANGFGICDEYHDNSRIIDATQINDFDVEVSTNIHDTTLSFWVNGKEVPSMNDDFNDNYVKYLFFLRSMQPGDFAGMMHDAYLEYQIGGYWHE